MGETLVPILGIAVLVGSIAITILISRKLFAKTNGAVHFIGAIFIWFVVSGLLGMAAVAVLRLFGID